MFCDLFLVCVVFLALHTAVVQGIVMDSNKSIFVQQLLVHKAP